MYIAVSNDTDLAELSDLPQCYKTSDPCSHRM